MNNDNFISFWFLYILSFYFILLHWPGPQDQGSANFFCKEPGNNILGFAGLISVKTTHICLHVRTTRNNTETMIMTVFNKMLFLELEFYIIFMGHKIFLFSPPPWPQQFQTIKLFFAPYKNMCSGRNWTSGGVLLTQGINDNNQNELLLGRHFAHTHSSLQKVLVLQIYIPADSLAEQPGCLTSQWI